MSSISIKGFYRDCLRDRRGATVADSGWRPNMIVMHCRMLLSGFLKNDTAAGVRALQVGKGDPSWDTTPPPLPDPNTLNALIDATPFEVPVAQLVLQYLDSADNVIATPTNHSHTGS